MISATAKARLLVLAVFIVGGVTGSVLTNAYQSRVEGASRQVRQVQDLLGLTAEQRGEWERIVQESRPEFEKLRRENRKLTEVNEPKFEALYEQTRTRVRAILTDEQKKIYEKFNDDQRRRQREARARQQQNQSNSQ